MIIRMTTTAWVMVGLLAVCLVVVVVVVVILWREVRQHSKEIAALDADLTEAEGNIKTHGKQLAAMQRLINGLMARMANYSTNASRRPLPPVPSTNPIRMSGKHARLD